MTRRKQNQTAYWLAVMLLLVFGIAGGSRLLGARSTDENQTHSKAPFVVRVYYETIRDLERLQGYDLWEYNNNSMRYVLVSVDDIGYDQLVKDGWNIEIDSPATEQVQRSGKGIFSFLGGYRTVSELYSDLAAIEETNPSLTELVDYGDSYCKSIGGCATLGGDDQPGFDLLAMRVTNESIAGSSVITPSGGITRGEKPIFFLMANIHAREITTPEIAMRFLDWLVEGYGHDADITWFVDWHEIWIVPTVNPDGHWLVELGTEAPYSGSPFSQRKNANRDADGDDTPDCTQWPPFSFAQYGIDLNRNHSFGWGPPGSSNQPCDLIYRGPSPASEIEVDQLENLVRALIPDQRGPALTDAAPQDTTGLLISLHSYSNLVLWPWGNIYEAAPNRDGLKAIGDRFAHFNDYTSCQPTECLYAANGASDDWAYGELGIPAFTFEIGDQFMPPYEEIDTIQWPDNQPALAYAARIARTPYATIKGPDVNNIRVSGWAPTITITAVVADILNGNEPIASAVYSLDTPFWDDAEEFPLAPVDGAFDADIEMVQTALDVSGLTPGRHTIFMRGQDQAGHWGPVSAAFVYLANEPDARVFFPAVTRP